MLILTCENRLKTTIAQDQQTVCYLKLFGRSGKKNSFETGVFLAPWNLRRVFFAFLVIQNSNDLQWPLRIAEFAL